MSTDDTSYAVKRQGFGDEVLELRPEEPSETVRFAAVMRCGGA